MDFKCYFTFTALLVLCFTSVKCLKSEPEFVEESEVDLEIDVEEAEVLEEEETIPSECPAPVKKVRVQRKVQEQSLETETVEPTVETVAKRVVKTKKTGKQLKPQISETAEEIAGELHVEPEVVVSKKPLKQKRSCPAVESAKEPCSTPGKVKPEAPVKPAKVDGKCKECGQAKAQADPKKKQKVPEAKAPKGKENKSSKQSPQKSKSKKP